MEVYTYFDGEKLILEKEADSFIARADPEQLDRIGRERKEQTSSASWRIRSDTAWKMCVSDTSWPTTPTVLRAATSHF